jgi:hypothetical protein
MTYTLFLNKLKDSTVFTYPFSVILKIYEHKTAFTFYLMLTLNLQILLIGTTVQARTSPPGYRENPGRPSQKL